MRDPARIDYILDKLRDYWKKNDQLRLGQIIDNIHFLGTPKDPDGNVKRIDLFFVEDGCLYHGLQKLVPDENNDNKKVD